MIVWHKGRKYDVEGNELKALEALGIGYERVNRADGLKLYLIDLAVPVSGGWRLNARGRHALAHGGIDDEAARALDRGHEAGAEHVSAGSQVPDGEAPGGA